MMDREKKNLSNLKLVRMVKDRRTFKITGDNPIKDIPFLKRLKYALIFWRCVTSIRG
jgi:hypothetical protein